jgi:hypothetical protein
MEPHGQSPWYPRDANKGRTSRTRGPIHPRVEPLPAGTQAWSSWFGIDGNFPNIFRGFPNSWNIAPKEIAQTLFQFYVFFLAARLGYILRDLFNSAMEHV